jgi:serine/threonine protein kinase/tetratricopeptide (TPR) repeat protein
MMSNEPEIFALFHRLAEADPTTREQVLTEVERDDPALAHAVRRMLRAHQSDGLLDSSDAAEALVGDPEAMIGRTIGPYVIEKILGQGGMGVVFAARQEVPLRRRVALKLIRPGLFNPEVARRFETERRALALMEHPGIAHVLDAGATEDDRAYVAMELVDGLPITDHCDRHRLTVDQRLDLFLDVCRAVQHAHQKGIIHRDLKPSNILVAVHDGHATPKIIDFGIAKAISNPADDDTRMTFAGYVLGTPESMSPEQAATPLDVDTRSDVYSLGVLLFYILSGQPPFDFQDLRDRRGYDGIRDAILHGEPRSLTNHLSGSSEEVDGILAARRIDRRALRRILRGDVRWIVTTAMAKDRELRYAGVSDLINDIERFRALRPTVAGPPSRRRRIDSFVRRHRVAVMATATTLAALIVAVAGVTVGLVRASAARDMAQQERVRAEQVNTFLKDMLSGVSPFVAKGRDTTLLLDLLAETGARIDPELTNQPLVAADLHQTLANAYRELGSYAEAETHGRSAVTLLEGELGKKAPLTLQALRDLALTLAYDSRFAQSENLTREILGLQTETLGADHPDTLTTTNNLALIVKAQGHFSEALPLFERVADIRRRTLGIADRATLISLSNLAMLLRSLNRTERAERLMREVVAAEREHHPGDPDGLISLDQLGMVLTAAGKTDEAIACHREALEGMRRVFGPNHPDTLTTSQSLAHALLNAGDPQQAEGLLRDTLERVHKTLGRSDLRAVFIGRDLARCLHALGQLDEAEAQLRRTIADAREVLPDGSPQLDDVICGLAAVLVDEGATDEAEELLRPAVERLRASLGDEHPATRRALATLKELDDRTGHR